MPRKNLTLSFTANPDLKDQIESIAKAANISRSKAIAGLVQKGIGSDEVLGRNEDFEVVLETDNFSEEISKNSTLRQLEIEKLIELFRIYRKNGLKTPSF